MSSSTEIVTFLSPGAYSFFPYAGVVAAGGYCCWDGGGAYSDVLLAAASGGCY